MLGDNFYNGAVAPPGSLFGSPLFYPSGIPVVGTGANDIPAIMTADASYAIFSFCSLNPNFSPATIPITITSSDVPYIDEKLVTISVDILSPTIPLAMFTCYAKYSRTWWNEGPSAPGDPQGRHQVWRFLIQGESNWDFVPTPGAALPPCDQVNQHSPIYQGFIDYVLENPTGLSGAGTWSVRLSLSHHAGCYSHVDVPLTNGDAIASSPIFGPPPSRHENDSFHLVAPASGWNWLNGNSTTIESRLNAAQYLRGEVRSNEDILNLSGLGYGMYLTEYGWYWDTTVALKNCDCGGGAPPNIYYNFKFSLPGLQPVAYAFCFDSTGLSSPPYPWLTENMTELFPFPNLSTQGPMAYPFWKMELGSWSPSAVSWTESVQLFACGGVFYLRDFYNRGNLLPFPDTLEPSHDLLQIVWGTATDHVNQNPFDVPETVTALDGAGNPIDYFPSLLTDFANQLEHRDYYPSVPTLLPPKPVVHFGDRWVMSNLVWQTTEQ